MSKCNCNYNNCNEERYMAPWACAGVAFDLFSKGRLAWGEEGYPLTRWKERREGSQKSEHGDFKGQKACVVCREYIPNLDELTKKKATWFKFGKTSVATDGWGQRGCDKPPEKGLQLDGRSVALQELGPVSGSGIELWRSDGREWRGRDI